MALAAHVEVVVRGCAFGWAYLRIHAMLERAQGGSAA